MLKEKLPPLTPEERTACRNIISQLENHAEDNLFPELINLRNNHLPEDARNPVIELNKPNAFHTRFDGDSSICFYLRWCEKEEKDTSGKAIFFILRPEGKLEITGVGPKPEYTSRRDVNVRFNSDCPDNQEPIVVEVNMNQAGWGNKVEVGFTRITENDQAASWQLSR